VSNIVIDISTTATDTIGYVATDNAGNTATSTRTVIVAAPSIVPDSSTEDGAKTTPAN
jgi:isoaspartyl peptidase/L-asparaginase-like protein (Ntn-hydrolase superfamily)